MPQVDEIEVSITSVYNKINGVSTQTSAAPVRESAAECARIVETLGGQRTAWFPGYRVRILDGNCIETTRHRIAELRRTASAAWPGESLAVYDPQLGCVVDVVPCEDDHAPELPGRHRQLGDVL